MEVVVEEPSELPASEVNTSLARDNLAYPTELKIAEPPILSQKKRVQSQQQRFRPRANLSGRLPIIGIDRESKKSLESGKFVGKALQKHTTHRAASQKSAKMSMKLKSKASNNSKYVVKSSFFSLNNFQSQISELNDSMEDDQAEMETLENKMPNIDTSKDRNSIPEDNSEIDPQINILSSQCPASLRSGRDPEETIEDLVGDVPASPTIELQNTIEEEIDVNQTKQLDQQSAILSIRMSNGVSGNETSHPASS